jgi:ribose transport system permease protein
MEVNVSEATADNEVSAAVPPLVRAGVLTRALRTYRTELAMAIAIVLIEVVVSFWIPQALSRGNVANIAQAAAPLVLMSLGVLLVVITGGIDLSVGSIFSLTGMVTGVAMSAGGLGWPLACVVGLCVGLGVGAVNGALVTFVGLAPFVVTLISYAVAGSLSFVITNGQSIAILDENFWLLNGGSIIPGVVNYLLYCIVFIAVAEFALRRLVLGRWVFAVGSNDKAAKLLGIPVRGIRFSVYVLSGLFASFSSLISLSYISNSETTAGANLMLQAIAACVIGGASLFGGTGSAIGAMLGAVMITVIQNGVNLIGINSFWQGSVTGLVILIAVLIDRVAKVRS